VVHEWGTVLDIVPRVISEDSEVVVIGDRMVQEPSPSAVDLPATVET
jgi:hypothetical protein